MKNWWKIVQGMQRSILTRWLWQMWQHDETGRIVLLPIWRNPGRRWYRCNFKE